MNETVPGLTFNRTQGAIKKTNRNKKCCVLPRKINDTYIYTRSCSDHSQDRSHEVIDFVINLKLLGHQPRRPSPFAQMEHFPQIVSPPCWPLALQLRRHPFQRWWHLNHFSHLSQPSSFFTSTPTPSNKPLLSPTPFSFFLLQALYSQGMILILTSLFLPPLWRLPPTRLSPQTRIRVHVRPGHAHGLRGTQVTKRHREGVCSDDSGGARAAGDWREQVHMTFITFPLLFS